jgi:hypothetical protein
MAVVVAAALDFVLLRAASLVGDGDPSSEVLEWLTYLLGTFLFAQFSLLALWFVFGPQSLLIRATSTLVFFLALILTVALGLWWTDVGSSRLIDFFVPLIAITPITMLLLTLPLWPLRLLGGWRIDSESKANTATGAASQFRLQDLFVVTTAVAVALGALQLYHGIDRAGTAVGPQTRLDVVYWCAPLTVTNLIFTLLVLWLGFESKFPLLGGILLVVLPGLGVFAMAVGLFYSAFGADLPSVRFAMLTTALPVAVITAVATLRVARRSGYRLVRSAFSRHKAMAR